jgi:hypothetical protein
MLGFRAHVLAVFLVSMPMACSRAAPEILLFDGSGTSPGDVAALEGVLRDHGLAYAKAGSRRLNDMSQAELDSFRLLIVPGGNFEQMGNGLTPHAAAKVRDAVHGGLSYLGICAGAFLAGASPYNGLDLTGGVRFGFYALEDRGVRGRPYPPPWLAARRSTSTGRTARAHEVGWRRGKICRQHTSRGARRRGQGWRSLRHAPGSAESWRRGTRRPRRSAKTYAADLIRAALEGTRLPHF